ncbi:hypothetical protein [Rhizobium binae]|uniref:hypothetical protein n=1 Tax=Rhizobium binae TaxID=1138190 RepID=UPI001C831841|nr:hypothetical protein [Rhizobium binae]MBX4941192.1 hypothetical protein [Rhizobium binae]
MRKFLEIRDWSPGYLNVTPQHVTIIALCKACGASREFDRNGVPANLRHALIADIERRLKCSSCGAKAGRLRFGSYVEGQNEKRRLPG